MKNGEGTQFRLSDGRLLGYSEYGDAGGSPIFYFHGFPSSRLEARLSQTTAEKLGVRLIATDRPGAGLSEFKQGRAILDWPADVAELADSLGIRRFATLGLSGGGPYAAACAYRMPERVVATGIVCGMGPADVRGIAQGITRLGRSAFVLSHVVPSIPNLLARGMACGICRFADRIPSWTAALISQPDKNILSQTLFRNVIIHSYREAVRNGPLGIEWELRLYARPWGFRPEDIRSEIHLWHGELDVVVPPSMGRYQAEAIPRCRARFLEGEGHFSLPMNHMEEILGTLKR